MRVNLVLAYLKKKKKTSFNTFGLFHISDHNKAINANSTKKMF